MDDIKILQTKVKQAREFAKRYFRTEFAATSNPFRDGKPSFFVEFPDVDKMVVTPSVFGRKASISFEYRLYFPKDKPMYWLGKDPFSGNNLPKLVVPE